VHVLGYPLYFLAILGSWRVLGAIALLEQRFPQLKKWGYAGVFFNMTVAAASHAAVGDYGPHAFHLLVTIFLAVLAVASWTLRPPSRTLGAHFSRPNARAGP
jgi:hypothetical protein